ncbi:MAG: glycine cleavage system protein GcvH [Planctomycetes bacterium]|nr:glycine cleavage system protein GcvH [Planctomycetota bacterium]
MIPNDRRYLETHEWAKLDGSIVAVGITDFAVKHLTDLVYIDLPSVGDPVAKGERFGEVESVKAVSDLNAPVSGEIVEVNDALAGDLEIVARDPYGDGWMIKVKVQSAAEFQALLDAAAYETVAAEEA